MSNLSLVLASLWLVWVALVRWAHAARLRPRDTLTGAFRRLFQLYATAVHRLAKEGTRNIPVRSPWPEPNQAASQGLVVVANHTSFMDPLLIQAALPFEVRWIMGADMAAPALKKFWDYARIIMVDRRTGESAPLREAIKHLKSGGVIGVFPEGFLERPPRHLLPFQDGVGLIISRAGSKVLPVVIDGTPQTEPRHRAILTPSRSRIRFLPLIDYTHRKLSPAEIAADLRRVFADATGWATSDRVPKWENGRWIELDMHGDHVE